MKFLKSLLMGTGGVVLAGLVLALLAPRAVHAVVATAVQVVNTSASPAITEDSSRQASQIVTLRCALATSCTQILPNGHFGADPGPHMGYVVPANEYFVLKSIDSYTIGASNSIGILFFSPPNLESVAEIVALPTNGQISFSSGIVAGPGVEVALEANPAIEGGTAAVTLHGYLTSN